ncbi:MAG: putative Ig domain-containing protein [Planctomycetes bacterium]|nr:putative Ig domain-containing protein [Planctomycetota bacterium]
MKSRFIGFVGLLTLLFMGAQLNAQAAASTGIQNYANPGNWLDEYYFDVDFGAGVASCDLSLDLTHTANAQMNFDIWMTDALTGLPAVADVPNYALGISYGATAPAAPPGTGGPVPIWGPNGIVYTGSFPLSGIVRFNFTVNVTSASVFPNDINVSFATTAGTLVSNAGFPTPTGTGLGYNFWSQVAATTPGLLGGWGRVSNSDYFQRNHSNVVWGATRFGSATDETQFEIEVALGATPITVDIGFYGFAYTQAGTASGQCVMELYDMQAGWDTPVATVNATTVTPGAAGGGYDTYTTASLSGLVKFRVVMRGQNLTGVNYTSTTLADFGYEVYFSRNATVGTLTTEPIIAAPRMSITPGGTTITVSTPLTAAGGSGTPTYNWTITGTAATLSANTGTSVNLVPAGTGQVTVRATNGATIEFAEETYTIGTGGGGGSPTITGPASIPDGVENVAYGPVTIVATGGTPPYTWSATGLPTGVSINPSTGEISGTPTVNGAFASIVVTVTDSGAQSDIQNYSITIAAAGSVIISTSALPGGQVPNAYSQNVVAVGGAAPYAWQITAGNLPTGLTLGSSTSNTVAISGIPSAAGTFNFTIRVDENGGNFATRALSITIAPASGGGIGGGGGGGGGGGCASSTGNGAWWLLAVGIIGGVALYRRRKTA